LQCMIVLNNSDAYNYRFMNILYTVHRYIYYFHKRFAILNSNLSLVIVFNLILNVNEYSATIALIIHHDGCAVYGIKCTLILWVRIPLKAWMSVCVYSVCR
jgi:hypothetical protein